MAQLGALGVQVPQAVDAQQALAGGQRGQQSLAAVGFQLPVPVELVRFAARQPQPAEPAEEARCGVEDFRQQGVADVAAQPRVAATLAQRLRQAEHGGGQALLVRLELGVHQVLAVQRRRAHKAAVLGHGQHGRRHVEPAGTAAVFVHHVEKEAQHAALRWRGRQRWLQHAAPYRRQRGLGHGARDGGIAWLSVVRLLHGHASAGRSKP